MREQLVAIAAIDRDLLRLRPAARSTNFGGALRTLLDRDYALLRLPEGSYADLFNDNALRLAGLANARAAVAIERWRLAHPGRLPDTLAELSRHRAAGPLRRPAGALQEVAGGLCRVLSGPGFH